MTEKKHQKHHHHHHKEGESKNAASGVVYSDRQNELNYEKARKEEKHHKRMEHLGEMGAVAAGAFARVLYIFNLFLVSKFSDPSIK